MPHQSGDHSHGFRGRAGPGLMRDGREALSMHPADLRRRVGPHLVHHPSPGGQAVMQAHHLHSSMYPPHPHSPAWYGSVAGSLPHRVPGSSLSVASGESLTEEQQHMVAMKEAPRDTPATEIRDKERIIQEALKRHMDDENSVGADEADAASALLFATTALRRAEASCKVSVAGSKGESEEADDGAAKEEDEGSKEDHQGGADECDQEATIASSVPLKKRRKLLDFLRKKPVTTATTEKQTLHVSPLPSPQVHTRVAGHESSEETVATASPPRTGGSSSTCLGNSYDIKDAQSLHEGAKINDTAEISPPPSQVVIEHFPTVLHNVLSSADVAENVIQWLPGGKTWKIIRWESLRREVLPKFFSKLQDEDGKVACSIDAFLWQLSAWGFEEVQSGPDAGAYTHKMFLKDSPDMCRQMSFAPKQNEFGSPTAALKKNPSTISEKMHAASQPHSILQVPSLASTSRPDAEATSKEAEKNLKWREEQAKNYMMQSPSISYPSMAGRPMRHPETPIFVNYRMGDLAYSDGWQYYPESTSPMAMRHMGSALTGYEQRLVQHPHFEPGMATRTPFALHSPQRVQAGRGALRLAGAGKVGLQVDQTPVRRSSFPVSSRGKGSRSPACRIPITPGDTASAASKPLQKGPAKEEEPEGLQKLSEAVAERVAVALLKTKRKLPLAGAAAASRDKPHKEEDERVETGKTEEAEAEETADEGIATGKTASV